MPNATAAGRLIHPVNAAGRSSRKAYLLTFGVLAVAIGVTSVVSVLLPGSGG
jgi:hypothetical protein